MGTMSWTDQADGGKGMRVLLSGVVGVAMPRAVIMGVMLLSWALFGFIVSRREGVGEG